MSKVPEIVAQYSPNYRKINVNRVLGGIRPGYLEFEIISEETDFQNLLNREPIDFAEGKQILKRISECKLIMDPIQARALLDFLAQQVEKYEKLFGKILSDTELQESFERMMKGRREDQNKLTENKKRSRRQSKSKNK